LRAFFYLALKRDLETFSERVCSLWAILDLACELEDILAHRGHLRFILTICMRCFQFNFEQVTNHIFIIFAGPLQRLSERCEHCIQSLIGILLPMRLSALIALIEDRMGCS